MIGFDYKFDDRTPAVKTAVDNAVFKNVGHAIATVRKDAIDLIKPGDGPSTPGTPPHTQTARVNRKTGRTSRGKLQKAIAFDNDKATGVGIAGPRQSIAGDSGRAHELGDEIFGVDYPERPYMAPALEKNLARYGDSYAASLTQ